MLPRENSVSDLTIRPTAKFLIARFVATGIVFAAIEIWYFVSLRNKGAATDLLPFIAPIIFIPALLRLFRRQLTTVTLTGDRLRYETGLAAKTTRTVQISKLQDVRVDQRPMQRMFKVGDISIETAGETSRLTIPDVDNPQSVADEILNRAQQGPVERQP
jgi:membrane protein YdbS with pleckstrin-like domain